MGTFLADGLIKPLPPTAEVAGLASAVQDVRTAIVTREAWRVVGAGGQPAFENSWVNVGGSIPVAAFRKTADGWVELRGAIASGTLTAAAFTLPAGYRPSALMDFPCTSNSAFGNARVNTDGTVVPLGGSNLSFWLDVRFTVD